MDTMLCSVDAPLGPVVTGTAEAVVLLALLTAWLVVPRVRSTGTRALGAAGSVLAAVAALPGVLDAARPVD